MRKAIFTFLLFLLTAIGFISCKKDKYEPNIVQYDDDQIQAYIKANGITGMIKDTSGVYYKLAAAGTGNALQYTDSISMVFTVHSMDGKYTSADTLINHFEDFTGHIASAGYPIGLQYAIHNFVNHNGAIARLLIPSHLAYGIKGSGSGSSTITNTKVYGNQSLDYYVHLIGDQDAYDQQVIKNYITANNLTASMKKDVSGIWYAITTPGTGTVAITDNSTITATFTTSMLNGTVVDQFNTVGGTSIDVPDLVVGTQIGVKKYATAGSLITFLIPSSLGRGRNGFSSAPANSCVRYDIQIIEVSP